MIQELLKEDVVSSNYYILVQNWLDNLRSPIGMYMCQRLYTRCPLSWLWSRTLSSVRTAFLGERIRTSEGAVAIAVVMEMWWRSGPPAMCRRAPLLLQGKTASSPPLTALTPHKLGERTHPPNVSAVHVSRRGTRRADGGGIGGLGVETSHHISPPHEEAEPGKGRRKIKNIQ